MSGNILNVSLSARRPDAERGISGEDSSFYSPAHLRERVYLHRATLARLATVQVNTISQIIYQCLNVTRVEKYCCLKNHVDTFHIGMCSILVQTI